MQRRRSSRFTLQNDESGSGSTTGSESPDGHFGSDATPIKPRPFVFWYFVLPIGTLLSFSVLEFLVERHHENCNLVLAFAGMQVSNYVLLFMLLLANKIYKNSSISRFIAFSGDSIGYFISHSITINNVLKGVMAVRLSFILDADKYIDEYTVMVVGILLFQLLIYFPLSEALSGTEGFPTNLIKVNLTANDEKKFHVVMYDNINPRRMNRIHYFLVFSGFFCIMSAIHVLEYTKPDYYLVALPLIVSGLCGLAFNIVPKLYRVPNLVVFLLECIAIGLLYITLDIVLLMRTLGHHVTYIKTLISSGFIAFDLFKLRTVPEIEELMFRWKILAAFALIVVFIIPRAIAKEDKQYKSYESCTRTERRQIKPLKF